MSKEKKKLLLIDGNAIIHRSFHALPPLTTKQGELVNAVYGFSSTLLSVIDEFKPDYIIASFDLPGPTFRHHEFKEYKATREKAPDELYEQIPKVKEVVRTLEIPIYEEEGFEADDIIGTISKKVQKDNDNLETIIVTGDQDTLQLVNENTKVYTMRRGLSDSVLYDKNAVFKKFGFEPGKLKDYKGLRGDPSDNIPGVKGIGEKTATSLIKEYGSLENIYQNTDKIKGSIKEKLERDKAQAIMSKSLGTIKTDISLNINLEKASFKGFDKTKIIPLFNELNFFSLVKRIPGKDDNENGSNENKGVKDFKYEILKNQKEINDLIKKILDSKEVAIHIEKNQEDKISALSFSLKTGRSFAIPFSKENIENLSQVYESKEIIKVGYDLKKTYKILKKEGIRLNIGKIDLNKGLCLGWDIMLCAYILDPGKRIDFEKLILSELGEEITYEKKKGEQLSIIESAEEYKKRILKACEKADYTLKLKESLAENMERQTQDKSSSPNLKTVFEKIEMPLVEIIAEMELNGIKINPLILEGILKKIQIRINNLEKAIHRLAHTSFNINSTQQLREVLYEKLKIPTFNIKKGKTGFSTASSELQKIKGDHKIVEKIEEYREITKLKNTYLEPLPKYADEDSRIHTTFNQAITATGRLSSTDPNLQNIPIKTDLGKLLRTAFEAEKNHSLVSADYSQIDLRAIAHVSNDKKLIEAFQRGDDIHRITAAEVNKVNPSQVTETMRRSAKELNFGIIYGMGAFGFSQSAGISREDAQKFIDTYMDKFSGVAEYMRKTREFAKKNGYVENIFGRKRNIPEINSPNLQVARAAERTAINMPIQGLAADIMKLSMIAAEKVVRMYEGKVKTILQVHDELIFEVKDSEVEKFTKEVKDAMENVVKLKVPLEIDIKSGENWGEL